MKLRTWQNKAYDTLVYKQYRIINAMTGSGKSYLMLHLAAEEAIKENRKSFIVVPQEVISASFLNTPYSHMVFNAFDSKGSKVAVLSNFLSSDKMICVCSHASFINFYNHSEASDYEVYIDEAHHIESDNNQLGKVVHSLHDNKISHITLTTATFFRGDKINILHDDISSDFVRYDLNVEEYIENLKYIKNIKLDVELYDITKPFKALKDKFDGKKTIVYLPYVQTREFKAGGSKEEWVKGISKVAKGKKVLDLVNDEIDHRNNSKAFLIDNQSNKDSVDVIVALNMMKEGANFVYADRAIVYGSRGSIVEVVQILGRIMRDAPGKETVHMTMMVPRTLDSNSSSFNSDVESYIQATLMSMIISDALFDDNNKKVKGKKTGAQEKKETIWSQLSSELRLTLMSAVSDVIIQLPESTKEEYLNAAAEVVKEILPNMSQDFIYQIAHKIISIYSKKTFSTDLSLTGHKVIKEVGSNPAGWMVYSTQEFGIKSFKELRDTINSRITFEDLRVAVKEKKIITGAEYLIRYKEILGAVSCPQFTYKNEWRNWMHFLGTDTINWIPYQELKAKVATYHCKNAREYAKIRKSLGKAPTDCKAIYGDEWEGWSIFLGNTKWVRA